MAELHVGGLVDPAAHERTGEDVKLKSEDLTIHGVIVGMTGSGKTGLGIVLIEEVLRAGIPALLMDPKGDLTNLRLTFPELSAAEFRPWIDESQARAAGVTPEEFAAQQATAWTEGLAGWGYGPEQIDALRAACEATIYTPGSQSGVPINIVGSLQAPATDDAEVVGDEIDGYVSGLLGLVGIEADPLSSREHILLANLVQWSWSGGRSLDLPTLVGMVQQPPIRKLGVFELDQFFPANDRTELAMRLNGLLASPAFAAWAVGQPLDIDAMLRAPDGRPRCAIVTTAHLSDEERQFVTSLVLSKLVTWMRRQSGTTELRALLYMDEVAGYLPPTAVPPTKRPIMTLMKQARAFGVGVVLATQNPVDIDYKALNNAGTWMVGRLQTERDKMRLLDGMSAAAGGFDVGAVGDTISGLAKREFVLRRAGEDRPEVFTTRWAMSYLRGPLTREQIAQLTGTFDAATTPAAAQATVPPANPANAATALDGDATPVMPTVAHGVAVRWVDPAAPWLAEIGGDPISSTRAAAAVARVTLRYDESKADLVIEQGYEAVLFPLGTPADVTRSVAVDYDDRDLHEAAPDGVVYRLTDAPINESGFWKDLSRDLTDHLIRSRALEVPMNAGLKLYGRPGESVEDFTTRCLQAANERSDADIARLRDKYERKLATAQDRVGSAEDAADVAAERVKGAKRGDLLSSAGTILGGLLGGRRSSGGLLGSLGRAAGQRSRSSADTARVEAARNKVDRLEREVAELEAELEQEVTEIDVKWMELAKQVATLNVSLERTDVKVTQLVLAWLPT
ncbi:MAG: ATP-binding protein [Acidimicrobiia bacterium]|nr:ATP-binding protein [Acidimicrobiia bacterium]